MKHFDEARDNSAFPVLGLEDEYPPGFVDPPHRHKRAQLLYASSGVMSVIAGRSHFIVPPQRAVWIPPMVLHELSCRGNVSLRTLYFNEQHAGIVGRECGVIEISDFLRALIVETVRIGAHDLMTERKAGILRLLVNEIQTMPQAPIHVPMPRDVRLLRVCHEILANPAERRSLDDLAACAGMGRRTLTRLFRTETGMGVAIWRQQVRLAEAQSMLATGRSVGSVASELGYESSSAFSSMFRRSLGAPPGRYPGQGLATKHD